MYTIGYAAWTPNIDSQLYMFEHGEGGPHIFKIWHCIKCMSRNADIICLQLKAFIQRSELFIDRAVCVGQCLAAEQMKFLTNCYEVYRTCFLVTFESCWPLSTRIRVFQKSWSFLRAVSYPWILMCCWNGRTWGCPAILWYNIKENSVTAMSIPLFIV